VTPERSRAYARLLQLIAEPVLTEDEREQVRRAADALVLASGELDVASREAEAEAYAVAYLLASSRRWPEELSRDLIQSLKACGPVRRRPRRPPAAASSDGRERGPSSCSPVRPKRWVLPLGIAATVVPVTLGWLLLSPFFGLVAVAMVTATVVLASVRLVARRAGSERAVAGR
jgi:hypothetical protein